MGTAAIPVPNRIDGVPRFHQISQISDFQLLSLSPDFVQGDTMFLGHPILLRKEA